LCEVNHKLPVAFGAFVAMHQKICDEYVHVHVRDDLVKHLWTRKGNAT
jgi:hypothetical protein